MSKTSDKLEMNFDDVNEMATIEGIKICYGLFKHFAELTPPGYWFRVIKSEDGVVTFEQRRFADEQ